MAELAGHVAMLTGGAGRLGRAIATELANAGATVGVVDAKGDAAAKVAAGLRTGGARTASAAADVSHAPEVEAALDLLERELGPVDLLVNAHGIFPNTPVIDMDESEWDRVFEVNTKGTMLTWRALPLDDRCDPRDNRREPLRAAARSAQPRPALTPRARRSTSSRFSYEKPRLPFSISRTSSRTARFRGIAAPCLAASATRRPSC